MNIVHFATSRCSISVYARAAPLIFIIGALCAVADKASANTIYPDGIQDSAGVQGLYPGGDVGSCCWMARSVHVKLVPPSQADAVVVTIFIPTYALRGNVTQSVTAQLGTMPKETVCCLGAGIHELAFGLPAHHGMNVNLDLTMGRVFVPAHIGLGTDRRQLSALLRSVQWRNTVGGAVTSTLDPRILRALLMLYVFIFLCAVVVTYRWPIAGAALLIATSPFALYAPLDGTTVTLPKVMLIAVAAGVILRRPAVALLSDRRIAALLCAQALIALTLLASLHNATFHGPVWREFFKALQYALTAWVAFVAFRADEGPKREDWIRGALLATTAVVSLAALLQLRTGAPMGVFIAGHSLSRIAGPLEGPNQLCAFLGIALPIILAFALNRRGSRLDIAVLFIGCLAALLTFSRGGVTALVIALALVYVLLCAQRFKRVAYAIFGVVFAAAFVLAWLQFAGFGSATLERTVFGAPNGSDNFNGGLGTRTQLWHGAYVLWRSHPWLGVGAGNYEFKIAQTGAPGVRTHANSAYFQTLAEEGIVGFVALALLAIVSVRVFAGSAAPLPAAILAVTLAVWFHQITDYVTFYPKVGVLLWAFLGIGLAAYPHFPKNALSAAKETPSAF